MINSSKVFVVFVPFQPSIPSSRAVFDGVERTRRAMVESFRSAEGCAAPGRADERWPGFDARNLVLRRNVPTSVGQIQAAVHTKPYHRRRNQQTNGLCGGRRRRRRQDAELLREHSRPLSALADLLVRSTAVVHAAGVELPTIHVPLETSSRVPEDVLVRATAALLAAGRTNWPPPKSIPAGSLSEAFLEALDAIS